MDKRKFNGGSRPNSGRKSKAEELRLIEKLNKYVDEEKVFKKLMQLIEEGNLKAVELYFHYKYGKPVAHKVLDADVSVASFDNLPKLFFKSTEELNK